LKGLTDLNRVSKAMLSIDKLDMNSMIKSITDAMKFQIDTAGVSVTVADLPGCLGDAVQTNQVFTNILDNAIKYLDPGRKGMIDISAAIDNGRSVYRISDNGIGIAPKDQSRVFELFHRLDPKCPVAGDGVGLAAALRILDRQDGQIRLESEPGEGTSFFVSLPNA
ncbi:MAG: PAS domain-containing sensor histidine kinase, partial [Gammaproteobacteria bacterium]|nr:PAS domain-containing sensor histidine kinase [Gammaproteobacteria bacterium]